MHRIALLPLVALPMAGAIALSTPACGDACEDLAPVCERCTDVNVRASCDQTVQDNVQDVCSAREGLYERDCPELLTAASSTGVVTNASVTSASSGPSSSSAGGSGGAGTGGAATGGAGGAGGN